MLLLGLLLLSEICATGSAATRSDHRSGIRHDDLPRLEYAIIPEAVGADFSLAMTVNGTYLALAALGNGTSDLVLRAQLEGTSPGTPGMLLHVKPTLRSGNALLSYKAATGRCSSTRETSADISNLVCLVP